MPTGIYPRPSLSYRFYLKVNKEGVECPGRGKCWVWTGGKFNHGYGQILVDRKRKLATRVSWEIHRGPIPKGMLICHHCDTAYHDLSYRLCVNPDHLFLGTHLDNLQDMISKGRQVVLKGVDHYKCVLTEEDVREIRRRYKPRCPINGGLALAKKYKTTCTNIVEIIKGRSWRHLI